METFSLWPDTPEKIALARTKYDRVSEFSERYRNDASLRALIDDGDVSDALADLGIDLPSDVEARIVADTPETFHFILPPDPNAVLSDETLDMIAGGKSAGSAGTAGTASTAVTSTALSSAGSAGSVSTAGTAS